MTRARLRRYFRHGFFPQLIALEACARHGSVTRAAQELALAQPTVSCLLKKLSETVGGAVLEARYRRMEPTELGRELLSLCDELFDAFDRLDGRLVGAIDRRAPTHAVVHPAVKLPRQVPDQPSV